MTSAKRSERRGPRRLKRGAVPLVLALCVACREPPGVEAPAAPSFDQQLAALRAGSAGVEVAGIALARVARDGALHVKAVGCARFAADGRRCERALSPTTMVRVASISKLITALLIMRLSEAGRLSLDAVAADLLAAGPDAALADSLRHPAFPEARVTVAQLLSHMSSLRDGEGYSLPAPATLATLMQIPGRFDLAHAPGTYFSYANINYVVLGAVVEALSRERFDVVARRELLTPVGVTAGYGWASAGPAAAARAGTLVRRRTADEQWQPQGPWQVQVDGEPTGPEVPPGYVPSTSPQLFSPHGGLRISAADLALLLRAALAQGAHGSALLSREALALWVGGVPAGAAQPGASRPRLAAGAVPGDLEGGFYQDYTLGNHRFALRGRAVRAHFGDAYGLRGGAFFDPVSAEVWVYLITGYGGPPLPGPAGSPPGLDAVEAAAVQLLWSLEQGVSPR
jgi:CubicO group peptidase (beta-lactamase class C family)